MKRLIWFATLVGLVAASGAYAQVSTINSAVVTPRVFNDITNATFTGVNDYPSGVTLSEAGVSQATGFANRDVWHFSNNGTTAYQFQNGDYFQASFNLTVIAPTNSPRKEAGFLLSTANDGDIQFIVNLDAHEVVQFGGISFYSFNNNNGITYTAGQTIKMGLNYFQNGDGNNALQFIANGTYSPIVEFAPGAGIGNGSTLGAYLQVVNDPGNPSNGGTALFTGIRIDVPEPSMFALLGLGLLPLVFRRRR